VDRRLRSDVDDPPPTLLAHAGDDRLAAVDRAHQVDVENELQVIGRHVDRETSLDRPQHATGVVDQQVDRPEVGGDRGDHGIDRGLVGDIGLVAGRAHAVAAALVHDGVGEQFLGELRRGVETQIADRDVGPEPGQPERIAAAQTAGAAGHQRDLAPQLRLQRGRACRRAHRAVHPPSTNNDVPVT